MADVTNQLKLLNVRLSFPDIWTAKKVDNKPDTVAKYGAHFLLDKKEHADQILEIKKVLWAAAVATFGKEEAKKLFEKDKLHMCLHEGNEKDYDGYTDDNRYVSSSSSKRPIIVDRDRTPLVEDDRKPYGGCYVNAVVRVWVQNNSYGKRVNAELMAIQFVTDGEPFGAAPVVVDDVFTDLDEGKGDKKPKKQAKGGGGGGGDEASGSQTAPDDDEIPF